MTATRGSRGTSTPSPGNRAWHERSAFGPLGGWPWWIAVLFALSLSLIGAIIDLQINKKLGQVYGSFYFIGCLVAICMVKRRNLFGPMIEPPLILTFTVPLVVSVATPSTSSSARLLAIGTPLISSFPAMAAATVAALLVGGIRIIMQREPLATGVERSQRSATPAARRANADDDRSSQAQTTKRRPIKPPASAGRPDPTRGTKTGQNRGASRTGSDRGRADPAARGRAGGAGNPSTRGRGTVPPRNQPRGGQAPRENRPPQPRPRDDDFFS